MWCVRKPICPMNWVHASVYVLFLLFPWDPTRLTRSTVCQDPPRHVWICGEFLSRFLACICPCGFISCLDLLDFLWMSRRCWWSRHCVANSVGDGQSWKTENGNGPTRRSRALTGLSGGEARLRRMFTIFILNNRVLGSWDKTQSRLWTITQPLLWS